MILVLQGLRLAEAPEPLRRAEVASELGQQLAQAVVLLAAGGDADQAADLGAALGELMDVGVAANLERAEKADLKGERRAEAEQVRRRVAQTGEALERNLEAVPEAARAGLERALRRSAPGWERSQNKGKGKGKGPPWLRDGKDAQAGPAHPKPPGQQKKAQPKGPGEPDD
jgi:hypothetical protein